MTSKQCSEIDVLKYDLAQERRAFDKLHKQYIQLLHKQGELEKENEELKKWKHIIYNTKG